MKRSEIYYEAMRAVIRAGIHDEHEIIEILGALTGDYNMAKMMESHEEEKEAAK